jgi:hypothetical protein
MSDCPNCGVDVEAGVRLCPACGFDTGEAQAEDVRALREAGRIKPGRLNDAGEAAGPVNTPGDESESQVPALPAEDEGVRDPRELGGGM